MTGQAQCVFFKDTAATEIYTLSLHDALPISSNEAGLQVTLVRIGCFGDAVTVELVDPPAGISAPAVETATDSAALPISVRSEEHTSELQSRQYLVCRPLLDKKKNPPPPTASY